MSRAVHADLSVFTIGGDSFLDIIKNVSFKMDNDLADGRAVNQRNSRNDNVKRGATIATGIMSNIVATTTTSSRVANLDVSSLLINSTTNIVSTLRGGSLTITNTFAEGSGVGDLWKVPIWTTQNWSATVQLAVPTAAFPVFGALVDGTSTAQAQSFSITVNGVTLASPMVLASYSHMFESDQIQMLEMTFEGRGTPTTVPATTNLLGYSVTSPGTPLACSLTSRSANGANYAGDFVIESASFSFNDAEIISTEYNFRSSGAIAHT